jgi:hypothetical protein
MKPKYSPQPWEARKFNDTKSTTIYAAGINHSIASVKSSADAHLVAAAPELLDFAIQYLYSEHNICAPHHTAAPYSREQLKEMALKAIDKAEGAEAI